MRRKYSARIALPLLLVAGFALFRWGRVRRDVLLRHIGDIKPAMAFSRVRVQGVLESDACRLRDGGMLCRINDGTGSIAALCSSGDILYSEGRRISVCGRLWMDSAGEFQLRAENVEARLPKGIDATHEGDRLAITGSVARVWAPSAGSRAPHRILLDDGHGSLEVVHWLTNAPALNPGEWLEVRGRVDLYEGRVQLKVFEAADLRRLSRR